MTFVKINRILRSRGIYRSDIAKKVKALTKEFAKLYPEPRYLASNFYVFLYLPKVMQRYATPANFWLFYYERLNADLKAINTNKNIEKTFFTRFLNNVHAKELFEKVSKPIDMPSDICDELEQLLVSTESSKSKVPTNKTMQAEYEESQDAFELSSYLAKETLEQPDNSDIFVGLEILPPTNVASIRIDFDKPSSVMSSSHFACLVEFYNATYNDDAEVLARYVGVQQGGISSSDGYVIPVSNSIQKFKSVKLFTCIYKSMEGTSSKVKRGSFVLAHCRNDRTPGSEASSLRPGQIVYFFRSSVSVLDPETGEMFDDLVHTFAFVRWFKKATQHHTAFTRFYMNVCKNDFEPDSVMSIIALNHTLSCKNNFKDDTTTVVQYFGF